MESYPTELLLGVVPLVFCVDATLASHEVPAGSVVAGRDTNPTSTTSSPSHHHRSQFDRFLDTLAASLLDDPVELNKDAYSSVPSPASTKQRTHDEVMRGLFRGEEGVVDSDHEDEIILGMMLENPISNNINRNNSSHGGAADVLDADPKRSRAFSKNLKFPGLGREATSAGGGASRTSVLRGRDGSIQASGVGGGGSDTSFARTLQEGQGFFQRARIVSISNRHGFPPSKDPTGEANRIREFFIGKTLRTEAVLAATRRRPIDGILPSGWLEKHAAALPSIIIVVAQVTSHQKRHEQNSLLEETLTNIQISLASKRACTIRVIGLVQEGISTQMATEWKQEMMEKLQGNPSVTLLDVADLQLDSVTSMTLRIFLRSVHDSCLKYYTAQTRHTKQKLFDLGPARNTPLLLPLAIRYCFKVAMFYEFRWRPEKSIRYLAEAYRHVETYFRYLLQQSTIGSSAVGQGLDASKVRVSNRNDPSTSVGTESEVVDMSIPIEDDMSSLLLNTPPVPNDMLLQCRVLADWLNFKILQSCFTSHTDGGLMAASTQWRRHVQVFCNPRRSFICSPDHAFIDWAFVAHQRMVASQLMERNPPRSKLGGEVDETELRLSLGTAYEAAADALLRLGAEVKKAATRNQHVETTVVDAMRSRYVGGLDKDGYQPNLQEAMKVDHIDLALDCLRRAISFHENSEGSEWTTTKRAGARLCFLTGGILLGRKQYEEATLYLEKAAVLVKGWSDLESKIRLSLVKAYDSQIPKVEPEQQPRLSSLLLGSYFKTAISAPDLQGVLSRFATSIKAETILWSEEAFDEDQHSLPISFVLMFPSSTTHARAGDTVKAKLVIKSNFDFDVQIDTVQLYTSAGKIALPPSDLQRRIPEGSRDAVNICLLKAKSTLSVDTSIELPKDIGKIAVDDSPGSSKPKIVRPRTAGLTAAAGSRLASESEQEALISKVHWSQKCLDGRPLLCDGLSVVFRLVGSASLSSQDSPTRIELVVKKQSPPTPGNVKRTPFEEENYLSSAWVRSLGTPCDIGLKCLRVLAPHADMTVQNLTEASTGGKALEGTVNRILLKLTAGSAEECRNVSVRFSVTSFLVSETGETTKIASEGSDDADNETWVHPTNPAARTPMLVREDSSASQQMTIFGYETPNGWAPMPGCYRDDEHMDYSQLNELLNPGEHVYAIVDIFRPSPAVTTPVGTMQQGEDLEKVIYEHSSCQSDVEISIQYQQKRLVPGSSETKKLDTVVRSQTVSIVWSPPLSANFSSSTKTIQPSGNRHPSNSTAGSAVGPDSELVLIDGERVTARCTLEAAAADYGLLVDVDQVSFLDGMDERAPCTFKLLSGKDPSGLLYKTSPQDPCRKLGIGSTFSLAWTSEVNIKSNYLKGSISASLGVLSVEWSPRPILAPADAKDTFQMHGPLRLKSPSKSRLLGPPCYIENAPFETHMEGLPDHLQIAQPFALAYQITNKTAMDQKLKVSIKESEDEESLCFMVGGLVDGEISLGPYEKVMLTYTAVATMVGLHSVPPICVMSERYQTWLVQESKVPGRKVFVVP